MRANSFQKVLLLDNIIKAKRTIEVLLVFNVEALSSLKVCEAEAPPFLFVLIPLHMSLVYCTPVIPCWACVNKSLEQDITYFAAWLQTGFMCKSNSCSPRPHPDLEWTSCFLALDQSKPDLTSGLLQRVDFPLLLTSCLNLSLACYWSEETFP